jgi:hypothetical protein
VKGRESTVKAHYKPTGSLLKARVKQASSVEISMGELGKARLADFAYFANFCYQSSPKLLVGRNRQVVGN